MPTDNLANLLDSMTETSVYVVEEKTRRLLYFNQRFLMISQGRAARGKTCHEVCPELCVNCPLDEMGDGPISCSWDDPVQKVTVDVTANRIVWDGHIPAVVVTTRHRPLRFEEQQGTEKIERLYGQSLVMVFDECVIVNVTADYYVNCHKDSLWTDIPVNGSFGIENRNYAQKVVHPKDLEQFNDHFSREALQHCFQVEGKKIISKRLRRLMDDGTYHMVEFTAAKINEADDDCWCALVFRDVQEDYQAEQKRNVEISQLATAARIAYQMLIAVNLTQNTYHMLEYDRFPVQGPDCSGCFYDLIESELATVHPDYRKEFIGKFSRRALIDTFTCGGRIVTMEVPHLGVDGAYHWHFTQVVRVESPYTDDLIEITLSRNIDEERRLQQDALETERQAKQLLEDALQKAEDANRAKSDFLSKMSHDIRTPMNAILGMTELAQMHIGDPEKLEDYLKKIKSSGTHLLGLINEVLDVSKIESGALQLEEIEFDLRDLMQDAVQLIQLAVDRRHQQLTVSLSDGVHTRVVGDAQRLKQVLVNILDNASKYTQEGGNVSFRLTEIDHGEKKVGTYRFVIEDHGIGMEPAYLKHIFDPFSRAADSRTSKVVGTGLGMTIVKSLVSMLGGDIQVESQYGKGSRFTITLCLSKRDESTAPNSKQDWEPEADYSAMRVLLVEDNELNRQIATEMLKLLGAQVEVAEDGRQAVEAVCSKPPQYYDLVLMDVQMPTLNGYDATKEIRNSGIKGTKKLPIIAMTANAFAEDAKQARLSGMNGHLAKPISIDQLKMALSKSLHWKNHFEAGY